MMNKINKWIFYIITVVILFSIPIVTVVNNMITLKNGTEFKFRVMAFDPYDMFRGMYLDIQLAEDETRTNYYSDILEEYDKNNVFVTIKEDYDGFAYFDKVFGEKPEDTINYVKATVDYSEYANSYYVESPLKAYYMNEEKSYGAEKIYDDNIEATCVKVRVKDGNMTIVGIYVDDVLIDLMEYVEDK